MVILDTNVVSELMRTSPDPGVVAWARAQPAERVHTTAVTVAEIAYGVARLPPGQRQRALAAAAGQVFTAFAERVPPFDVAAGNAYGVITATRERAGTPITALDAQIAAITRTRTAVLATRDTTDFTGLDLDLVNPWTPQPRSGVSRRL